MKRIFLTIGIVLTLIAIIVVSVLLVKGVTFTAKNPIVTISIEGYDSPIKLELNPKEAPNAVANFIKLVNNGYYDDFKMKIAEDRILGDESMEKAKLSNIMEYPQSDYVYGIKGDFLANNKENLVRHKKGVITMERDDYSYFGFTEEGYNSANCNFCILTEDKDNYNGYYASFGRVIEGMDVLDKIAESRVEEKKDDESSSSKDSKTENKENSTEDSKEEEKEVNIIKINSISVETFGIDYGLPEYVNYEENLEKVNKVYNQYLLNNSTSLDSEGIVKLEQ